jgi:glycosyltransferase involved in cell wall biosynthesis
MRNVRPLSGVVTTFNNEASLGACLASLTPICSEIIVLDSGSTDQTRQIAAQYGARFSVQPFAGYSAQKTAAIALATHDWIVLLDSDEALDVPAQRAITQALQLEHIAFGAFKIARRERVFWRYQHRLSAHNKFVRVFDRRLSQLSTHAVHESVRTHAPIGELAGVIVHEGDSTIELKLQKLNRYSSLAAAEKFSGGLVAKTTNLPVDLVAKATNRLPSSFMLALRMTLYPLWYFLRAYLLRRQFLHGWAGYINSVELAHYAFLKYAKLYEIAQHKKPGKRPQ